METKRREAFHFGALALIAPVAGFSVAEALSCGVGPPRRPPSAGVWQRRGLDRPDLPKLETKRREAVHFGALALIALVAGFCVAEALP